MIFQTWVESIQYTLKGCKNQIQQHSTAQLVCQTISLQREFLYWIVGLPQEHGPQISHMKCALDSYREKNSMYVAIYLSWPNREGEFAGTWTSWKAYFQDSISDFLWALSSSRAWTLSVDFLHATPIHWILT